MSVIKPFTGVDDRLKLSQVIPLDTPFTLNIYPSNACNFKCIYCVQSLDKKLLNVAADQISRAISNSELYNNRKIMEKEYYNIIRAFGRAIDSKSPWTERHSTRTSEYAVKIAKVAGCSQIEIDMIKAAGCLHDIGKIGIPDNLLYKKPPLTNEEKKPLINMLN